MYTENLERILSNLRLCAEDPAFAFKYATFPVVVTAGFTVAYLLYEKCKRVIQERRETSFNNAMIECESCYISKKEDGSIPLVTGNMVTFISGKDEHKRQDSEYAKMIKDYCKYVDKTYGKKQSCVEKNIGKDVFNILNGLYSTTK